MQEKVSLEVDGMTCNHCANTVDGIIKQEGGSGIHVDYLLGEASFEISDDQKTERILKRLKNAGYAAEPLNLEGGSTKKQGLSAVERKFATSLPFSLVLFAHMFAPMDWWINDAWVQFFLCLPVFTIGVLHFGKSSYESIRSGSINMDILIFLGSSSAFFYSLYGTIAFYGTSRVHDFLFFETAATIITLVLLGYVIEHKAVQKTTTILKALFDSKPLRAKRLIQKGLNQEMEAVLVDELVPGDQILVNTGDKVPADAILNYGTLTVDESILTGESDELTKTKGQALLSGSIVINGNGVLTVTKIAADSTIGQIIELVKTSRTAKPEIQKLADKISSWFVPAIVSIAALTFGLNFYFGSGFSEALLRAIAVMVISCPCAMGLATPTAVSVGLGMAGKLGIIVKRADVFEQLEKLKHLVFDKTGTLTEKQLNIEITELEKTTNTPVLGIIKALEKHSNHPLATALLSHLEEAQPESVESIEEVKGLGMKGQWKSKQVVFGSAKFTGQNAQSGDLFLAIEGQVVASVAVKSAIQKAAAEVVQFTKKRAIIPHILSGDSLRKTTQVATALGIDQFSAEQLPEQKLEYIVALRQKGPVGMVGDGINDAPALSVAEVGISIGNSNALAAESASVVIMGSNIKRVKQFLELGNAVVSTIRQNLFWAFAYNIVAIPLAALGYLDPMVAALSMAFSDVVVIGNSLRLRLRLHKHLD